MSSPIPLRSSPISSRIFGVLSGGEPVQAWILHGAGGLVLETITYGASVTRLLVPDRQGRLADVVLGFDSLDAYVSGTAYMGAIAGRVAGRISNSRFSLAGKVYQLTPNDSPNHLHGGPGGFHARLWSAVPVECSGQDVALRLVYTSPDGEEGYPGSVQATVTYTVTAENAFSICTETVADATTPCSLTHHSYFNLAGEGSGTICDHHLSIDSAEVVAVDEHMTLMEALRPVALPGNDLRQARALSEVIPLLFRHHGDLYRLRPQSSHDKVQEPRHAARLSDPASGRVLDVFTTEDYIQLYTGYWLDGSLIGKSGTPYRRYQGLCLECEGYPDGANVPALGDILLHPAKPKVQRTIYAFSVQPALSTAQEAS